MDTRPARTNRRNQALRRPAHVPRPRPRAGAWQAFCRARRNAIQRRRPRVEKRVRQGYRQLALALPAAVALRPVPAVVAPNRLPPRRVRRHRV